MSTRTNIARIMVVIAVLVVTFGALGGCLGANQGNGSEAAR
jgi:hypothetical protein